MGKDTTGNLFDLEVGKEGPEPIGAILMRLPVWGGTDRRGVTLATYDYLLRRKRRLGPSRGRIRRRGASRIDERRPGVPR
jgi:hypothetical protein